MYKSDICKPRYRTRRKRTILEATFRFKISCEDKKGIEERIDNLNASFLRKYLEFKRENNSLLIVINDPVKNIFGLGFWLSVESCDFFPEEIVDLKGIEDYVLGKE